jgi:hypothetical protein
MEREEFGIPDDLRADGEGRRLWSWLAQNADGVLDSRPLVAELCRMADRLEQVRAKLAQQGLTVTAARGRIASNPLLTQEVRLVKQYENLWRTLGLSDEPEEEKRPVGRPPDSEKYRTP